MTTSKVVSLWLVASLAIGCLPRQLFALHSQIRLTTSSRVGMGSAYPIFATEHFLRRKDVCVDCFSTVIPQQRSRAHCGRTALKMTIAPPPEVYAPAYILSNEPEAEGSRLIKIGVPPEVVESYTKPGQFVKIRAHTPGAKPNFFAIASAPASTSSKSSTEDDNTFTFLVKDTPSNSFLVSASVGDSSSVEVSMVQGNGFDFEEAFEKYQQEFPTNNILLFATGTGLAPIAAVLDSNRLKLKTVLQTSLYARKATLYLGVKTPKHIPFASKLKQWQAEYGLEVIPVISQPQDPRSIGWQGRVGYIQQVFAANGGPAVPRNTGVLLCGQRDMTQQVRDLCLEAGVYEGRILLNF